MTNRSTIFPGRPYRENHELKVDMAHGCTHYVVAEEVTKGRLDSSALLTFKNAFVQRLSDNLPSIAVATLSFGGSERLEFCAGRLFVASSADAFPNRPPQS